jgi:hypothetical protein
MVLRLVIQLVWIQVSAKIFVLISSLYSDRKLRVSFESEINFCTRWDTSSGNTEFCRASACTVWIGLIPARPMIPPRPVCCCTCINITGRKANFVLSNRQHCINLMDSSRKCCNVIDTWNTTLSASISIITVYRSTVFFYWKYDV